MSAAKTEKTATVASIRAGFDRAAPVREMRSKRGSGDETLRETPEHDAPFRLREKLSGEIRRIRAFGRGDVGRR